MSDRGKVKIAGTGRLEAFSDGVFAIAITLLILEIKVPELHQGVRDGEVLRAIAALWPKLGGFVLSFLIIAIYWVNHHHLMHRLVRTDTGLLWHNIHLLFWISFFPFPTAFLGEHPVSSIAVAMYGLVSAMAAVAYYLLERHAYRAGLVEHLDSNRFRRDSSKSKRTVALYFAAIALAWTFPVASLFIYFAMAISYFLPQFESREGDR